MSGIEIALTVNGRSVRAEVEPRTHLADFLREDLLLTGTHLGCEQGVCGACTVMINGRPSRSCITLAATCDSADIRTIESFDDDPLMVKLRRAFSEHHGLQCGFCTPGFLATAYDVVRRLPDADNTRIRKELSGNLCRCTGYQGAVNAIEQVIANDPPVALLQPGMRTRGHLRASTSVASMPANSSTAPSNRTADTIPDSVTDGVRLERRVSIDAPTSSVWPVLSDIKNVIDCVPGGEVTQIDGELAHGLMTVALGPMRASFNGSAKVAFDPSTQTGHVVGHGSDRLTRSNVAGEMTFQLHGIDQNRSELALEILYQLKGPLAQFSRPAIVAEVADRILAETATNIAAKATGEQLAVSAGKPAAGLGLIWSALIGMVKGLFKR